jgi:hypothetical protein
MGVCGPLADSLRTDVDHQAGPGTATEPWATTTGGLVSDVARGHAAIITMRSPYYGLAVRTLGVVSPEAHTE